MSVGRLDTQTGITDRGWPRRVGRSDEDVEFGHGVDYVGVACVGEEARQDEAVERHGLAGYHPLGNEAGGFNDRSASVDDSRVLGGRSVGVGLQSCVGVDHARVIHVLGRVGLGGIFEVGFGGVAELLLGDLAAADGENEDDKQVGTHG